jgi:uncharacterized radical SAM superfamily Fe-S cluster-containing enzyme
MLRRIAGYAAKGTANVIWHGFQAINRRIPGKTFHPSWAPEPLLKSTERTKPTLGFPRTTDSLCPTCVKEVRAKILSGEITIDELVEKNPGEIKADIIERDGEVWMVKECPEHGRFEDIMSIDVDFMRRIEEQFPGRDFKMSPDNLHNHGSSSVKYGRGAVLTVDLTNRCNMMCDPCFMDANQVGYVHELTWDDIKEILDNSMQVKPQRQMSVQFSGGEPTISPHFLRAVAYSRELGYGAVQCATNGIRFAQDREFAMAAGKAGLRLAYLQFDGVGDEANSHRKVGNLYEVKQRAIDHLHEAGVDVTLVVTIVNTINNDQVGPIIRFLIDNIDKINALSFQPVSFTGRDEDIDDETRRQQRYTISHLAHDVKNQAGLGEPLRDWFPLSATGPFSDLRDLLAGPNADWGTLKCGCHPNCGSGTMVLVNRKTKDAVPMTQLVKTDQLLQDLTLINDTARSRPLTVLQTALAFVRNIRVREFPKNLSIKQLLTAFDGYQAGQLGFAEKARYEWRPVMVAAMWFQDLFNYDFRRTEMCIIPYGTQQGEISFCAYNTGIGWRQIIENMHMTASTADWFRNAGKHAVYAGGKSVPLPDGEPAPVQAPAACGSTSNAAMPTRPRAAAMAPGQQLLRIRS